MNDLEIVSNALDGGTLGVLGFFSAIIWRTLKRWTLVLELQEKLISRQLKHFEDERMYHEETSKEVKHFHEVADRAEKDLSDIRDALVPKKERSLVETSASVRG